MPIEKVPVVHKFGIISHSQRLELQERLLKQSYLATFATRKSIQQSRNPLEVTEEFIQQYNATESLEDKEKLDDTAHKMLQRIKRRVGLKDGGTGEHVDLPVAWTELSQLAQCKGKIQEECLDVLITSLDQAPLQKSHIPALFFLAETTLYWLRTDAVHQPYLRTGEIKLLRMGQLVFARLFYHHMAGQLQGQDEFKNRLFTYLNGFSDSQEAYSPYPNALLCVRYINEVGKIIIGDSNTEAGEIKEGDNVQNSGPPTDTDSELFHEASAQYEDTRSSHSAAISSSVHDLSPTLWHALDVWRCVNQLDGGLTHALKALARCGMGLASESWVDGTSALHVLGDAAKYDLNVLKTLQNLARGVHPTESAPPSAHTHTHSQRESAKENNEASAEKSMSHHDLSDILEKSETSAPKTQTTRHSNSRTTNPSSNQPHSKSSKRTGDQNLQRSPEATRTSLGMQRHQTTDSQMTAQTGTDYTTHTAWRAEVGSELSAEGRASQASSVITFTNAVRPDLSGLHGWNWEVAITYADMLADICLHGATSNIQKVSLVGLRKDVGLLHKIAASPECPMKSAGLLDLVYFHAVQEETDGSPNDWSWRVRYAAIQGLVKICRCCAADQTKEGMRTVAWNTLVRAHSLERDQRVLEALKVGQVESNIENLLSQNINTNPDTIGCKLAGGLSKLYLPPIPPPVEAKSPRRRSNKPVSNVLGTGPIVTTEKTKGLRTSLRDEIMLATALYEPGPSFNTRANFDLKRIVEDQWRKELQNQLEEEEEDKRKELDQKQKEDEEKQRKLEENRKEKLHNKYKGKAYQYRDFSSTSLKAQRKDSKDLKKADSVIKTNQNVVFGIRGHQVSSPT